jgi:hypothetical protein
LIEVVGRTEETENGLRIKGQSRIESIRTNDDKRLTVEIRTWHCSRLLRRDFNLLSYKMFHACQSSYRKRRVRELVFDLQEAAFKVQRQVPDGVSGQRIHSTMNLRLVSAESNTVFEAVVAVDHALSHMIEAGLSEGRQDQAISDFFFSFKQLQKYIFKDAPPSKVARR